MCPDGFAELIACRFDKAGFVRRHVRIRDGAGDWVPFALYPFQADALAETDAHRLLLWLKARQLGLTWLALADALHTLLFFPGATCLLFSLRDQEAMELLGRVRGMYNRLPPFLRGSPALGNAHAWTLPNGSRCLAFPTGKGDSYTAALAVIDEADLVPDLDDMLGRVKPTIDGGGRLTLLSRANKSLPESPFKNLYRAARDRRAGAWHARFFPWHARPDRDPQWYEEQTADSLARTGSLDVLWEHYPESDVQALAARTLDKRIPPQWLEQCYREEQPLADLPSGAPALPGLRVYRLPERGGNYFLGADPAEGNPHSDDSALCVLDEQGEQVAELAGKVEYTVLARYVDLVGAWYSAVVMVERNNHGHATIAWLREHSGLRLLKGHTDQLGWVSSELGKAKLYDALADAFRCKEVTVRSFATQQQLASIEANTLRAPEGLHDDRATAFALASVARQKQARRGVWRAEWV